MVRFDLFGSTDSAESPQAKNKSPHDGMKASSSFQLPSDFGLWSGETTAPSKATPRTPKPITRRAAATPPAFRSPPAGGTRNAASSASPQISSVSRRRENTASSAARNLTARSPDGQSIFALVNQKYIELRRLPLQSEEIEPESKFELPQTVCSSLEIDPPIELVCVDGGYRGLKVQEEGPQYIMLCLYTRTNAFLIKLKTSELKSFETIPESSVTEPLEKFLEHYYDATIVRIRAAPQAHDTGNSVAYSPKGSFAVLLEDLEANKYVLVLYHHETGGALTAPLKFAMEGSAVGERIVDFCFAESDGLTLFSSITVMLLQQTGDVHSASPIVFEGMKVQDRSLKEALNFLNSSIEKAPRDEAKCRQYKAARTFLSEAFEPPVASSKSKVATVRFLGRSSNSGAAHWPAKIQGPIYFHSELNASGSTSRSLAIEAFDGTECLAGLALAKDGGKIDFVGISPTTLVPRFIFESGRDGSNIDDIIFKQTALVESVDLGLKLGPVTLVKDQSTGSVLHLATRTNVYTVSTNAMVHTSKKLFGPTNDQVSTKAWTCVRITDEADVIIGVSVSSDPVDGHKVVAQLASGSTASGDVTRSKYAEELSTGDIASDDGETVLSSSDASPLLQELLPIIDQINAGLGGMERLVGSSTNYKDITPETLAWIAQRMDRCDKEIAIPVQEMSQIVTASRSKLEERLKTQQREVRKLAGNVKDTISRLEQLADMIEAAGENAAVQSQRSLRLYRICEQLVPTTTPGEKEFFRHVDRLSRKTAKLEELVEETKRNTESSCRNLIEGVDLTTLSQDEITLLNQTFKGSAQAQATARGYIQYAGSPKKDP